MDQSLVRQLSVKRRRTARDIARKSWIVSGGAPDTAAVLAEKLLRERYGIESDVAFMSEDDCKNACGGIITILTVVSIMLMIIKYSIDIWDSLSHATPSIVPSATEGIDYDSE